MDLFEIMTSTFNLLDKYAEDFYFVEGDYNQLLILRWMKKNNATRQKSKISANSICMQIEAIYNVEKTQAFNIYSKFKKQGLIDISRGKTDGQVFLTEKALELLENDDVKLSDEFYTEYIKICTKVVN